jgi:CheY-like chemotaxis protein
MSGLQLLEKMRADKAMSQVPVIIYTGKELTKTEEAELRQLAQTIIIKDVKSPERLLDETTLFLHRVESALPPEKQRLLDQLHRSDPTLTGKKALVVDDDIRNIFALTSVLESHAVRVLYAENGLTGIETLSKNPDVDVVLLDIMMPELDGYETLRRIRNEARWRALPVIAITAKALKEDREKCIQAGAFDYLPKPIEPDKLVDLIRFWTRRNPQSQPAIELGA